MRRAYTVTSTVSPASIVKYPEQILPADWLCLQVTPSVSSPAAVAACYYWQLASW